MAKTITAPAGERTRVLWLYSSSLPGAVSFSVTPKGGGAPSGTVEVESRQLFWRRRREQPLSSENTLAKGFTDVDYRVYVTPEQDCEVTFRTRHFSAGKLLFALIALVVLAAVAVVLVPILSSL